MGATILRCPHCKPVGTKVTTVNGRRLGFQPEALYVGYLVAQPRGVYKKPPTACPECGNGLVKNNGQALVEFAIILPLLLFILLGSMEAGFLLIAKAHQDRSTYLVAERAAQYDNESWNAVANKELPGCTVEISTPLPGLKQATSRCQYRPRILVGFPIFDGLPISSRESAIVPNEPTSHPSETPDASPSSS